jgi:DNA repair photolyase
LGEGVHTANPLKDGSQRESCGCIASKDIGRYGTCPHHCAYCYANSSFAQADDAHRRHTPGSEMI